MPTQFHRITQFPEGRRQMGVERGFYILTDVHKKYYLQVEY